MMDDDLDDRSPWRAQCEALYREHGARLLRLCRLLLCSPQEAEDVIQEVFLKLLERDGMGAVAHAGRDQRVSRPAASGVVASLGQDV